MIVGMNDDVGWPLSVEDHDLLMMGDRFPGATRNSYLLCFDRCHGPMIAHQYGSVRSRMGKWQP
jgi:hypothetical protein